MYGEGFRVPMFAELYNNHVLTKGNPNSKSETVKTLESSLESQITSRLQTKVTLYNNDFKNLIKTTEIIMIVCPKNIIISALEAILINVLKPKYNKDT